MPETPSFSFPKSERLSSKKLIEATFAQGQKTKAWPLVAKHLDAALGEEVPCQTLVSVSKRSFKRAVDRNRIKRLMKEAWRMQKPALYAVLQEHEKQRAIVLIYVGRELPTFEDMQASVDVLIQKMVRALNGPNETPHNADHD